MDAHYSRVDKNERHFRRLHPFVKRELYEKILSLDSYVTRG